MNTKENIPLYGWSIVTHERKRICDAILNEDGRVISLLFKNGKNYYMVTIEDLMNQIANIMPVTHTDS